MFGLSIKDCGGGEQLLHFLDRCVVDDGGRHLRLGPRIQAEEDQEQERYADCDARHRASFLTVGATVRMWPPPAE